MSSFRDGPASKRVGVRIVSDLALELRSKLLEVAGPITWPHNKSSWLASAARTIGITARTARSILGVEHPYPHSRTVERVRAAWARQQQKIEADARTEAAALRGQIAVLTARLATIDPEFHSETLAALRETPCGQSGEVVQARDQTRAVD